MSQLLKIQRFQLNTSCSRTLVPVLLEAGAVTVSSKQSAAHFLLKPVAERFVSLTIIKNISVTKSLL